MSKDMMPERWEIPLSCDYRSAANGDWVRAEDVEPLVAEITRLRANGCARNQGLTLHCGEAVLARDEITRLRARVEVLERLTRESLNVLTCDGGDDDPGHRCSHCDDYVDRNRQHRNALRAALKEAKP